MGYIHELRKVVGNTPIIMVGATVLLLNDENELLMLRRTDNGCWGVPGGAMELGETIEMTARRETREETNLELGSLDLFQIFSGPDLYYRYPNGAEVYNVSIVYISKESFGNLFLNSSEHSEYAYFPLDRIPEQVSPPIKPILQSLQKSRKK